MQFFSLSLETGLFLVPFMGEMPIPIIVWICIFLAAAIQLLLCRSKRRWLRYSMLGFNLAGFAACLVACEIDTGWDVLGWLIIGGVFLALLVGCAIGFGANKLLNRKKAK